MVGRKLMAAIGVGSLCLAIVACGGSGHSTAPSAVEIEDCLNGAGLAAELVSESEGSAVIGAAAPDGDLIVIVTVPQAIASEFDVAGAVTRRIKRELRKVGRGGIWTSSTANGGSIYIGTMGVKGVNGGLSSTATEMIARQCATEAKRADKAPGTEA